MQSEKPVLKRSARKFHKNQSIIIQPERLNEIIQLLEEAGFSMCIDAFLLLQGIILTASNGDEAYLISPDELGHIKRYGVDFLRGFHNKARQVRDDLTLSQRLNAYAEKTMANVVIDVQDAPQGIRNQTLFNAAVALGRLLHWDVFDYEQAFYSLRAASSLDQNEAKSAIKSGLEIGQNAPRPKLELERAFEAKSTTDVQASAPKNLLSQTPNLGSKVLGQSGVPKLVKGTPCL